VTLHVGAGTFKPVKTETIADHQMHGERFSVTDELLQNLINAEKIIAAGTTTLRTLESLHWLGIKMLMGKNDLVLEQWEAYELDDRKISYKESLASLFNYLQKRKESQLYCRTSLLIVPGYRFKSAEALITNFHQPKSTLLLLVAAFIGPDWKKVYDHALENNYRFLSYGDSSLLWRS
jgi:S-adenosylmethionine:tRNA ribosyltransferase-isomerase